MDADHKTVRAGHALKREKCTPGTRTKILNQITTWANDCSSDSPRVFSLTGQAGSGKTTIAYTIAKKFEKEDQGFKGVELAANFFCSRQVEETRRQNAIIPTLVYQLAQKFKPFAIALHDANDFDTVNQVIRVQMKKLLVRPWQKCRPSENSARPPYLITKQLKKFLTQPWQRSRPSYLIIIDALDEIDERGGVEFLRELLKAIREFDLRGFKFLVTSRLDPEVVELCESFTSDAVCRLQDVPIEEAKSDIEKYLRAQLPKLANSAELAELVDRASGLFIYAATAVKYLKSPCGLTSKEQKKSLSKFLSGTHNSVSSKHATSLIDEIYRQIMCEAFSDLGEDDMMGRLRLLYTCLCTVERTSPQTIARLVPDGDADAVEAILLKLHAVLYVQDNQVFWYHSSFPDFIFTESRSNFSLDGSRFTFSCDQSAHQKLLAKSCFDIMKSSLHFNMADIKSSFLRDTDITEELSQQIDRNISKVLRYACRHWVDHLCSAEAVDTKQLQDCLSYFLYDRSLFWIESMNLLGLRGLCNEILQRARQWVLKVRKM